MAGVLQVLAFAQHIGCNQHTHRVMEQSWTFDVVRLRAKAVGKFGWIRRLPGHTLDPADARRPQLRDQIANRVSKLREDQYLLFGKGL